MHDGERRAADCTAYDAAQSEQKSCPPSSCLCSSLLVSVLLSPQSEEKSCPPCAAASSAAALVTGAPAASWSSTCTRDTWRRRWHARGCSVPSTDVPFMHERADLVAEFEAGIILVRREADAHANSSWDHTQNKIGALHHELARDDERPEQRRTSSSRPWIQSSSPSQSVPAPPSRSTASCQHRNTKGYSSTCLAMGFANVRAGTQNHQAFLGTSPNISKSHSEISTRVPFCITHTKAGLARATLRRGESRARRARLASTRILGRRTAPFPPLRIPNRVPHHFT